MSYGTGVEERDDIAVIFTYGLTLFDYIENLKVQASLHML